MKQKIIQSILLMVIISLSNFAAIAQKTETVKLSGVATFATQNNSMFSGGRFGDKPTMILDLTATYRNFSISAERSSDLIDPTSATNSTGLTVAHSKTFGRYSLSTSLGISLFDKVKEFDLVVPCVVISRKGKIDLEFMAAYAYLFNSKDNAYVGRMSVGKSLPKGYSVKAYGWVMDWNGVSKSVAGEISKSFTKNLKASMIYHLNNFSSKDRQEFGAIRISYSF